MFNFTSACAMKTKANGKAVVIVPLLLYTDDLSATVPKNVSALMLGLFCLQGHQSTGMHSLRTYTCSVHQIRFQLWNWQVLSSVISRNYFLEEDVVVLAPVIACLCDNPRASELAGHHRGKPTINAFCRQCLVSLALLHGHSTLC